MQDGLGLTILKVLLLALIVFFVALNTYQISTIEDRIKTGGVKPNLVPASGDEVSHRPGAGSRPVGAESGVTPLPSGAVRANGVIILPNGIVIIPDATTPKILYPDKPAATSAPSANPGSTHSNSNADNSAASSNSHEPK